MKYVVIFLAAAFLLTLSLFFQYRQNFTQSSSCKDNASVLTGHSELDHNENEINNKHTNTVK